MLVAMTALVAMTTVDCSLSFSFEALCLKTKTSFDSKEALFVRLQKLAKSPPERFVNEIFRFAEALYSGQIPLELFEKRSSLDVAYLFAEKLVDLVDVGQLARSFQDLAFLPKITPLERLRGISILTLVGLCESKRNGTPDQCVQEITAPLEALLKEGLKDRPLDVLLYHPSTLAVLMQMYRGEEMIQSMDVLQLLKEMPKALEVAADAFIDFLGTMTWGWGSTKAEGAKIIQRVSALERHFKKEPGYYLQKVAIAAINGIYDRVQLLWRLTRNAPTPMESLLRAVKEKNALLLCARGFKETLPAEGSAKVARQMWFLSTMVLSGLAREKHLLTVDGVLYIDTAENLRSIRPRLKLVTAVGAEANHTFEYRNGQWEKVAREVTATQTIAS